MVANESREVMLKELADYMRPSMHARFTKNASDAEIRNTLAGAKEQRAAYEAMEAGKSS